ncbi:MAG: hypothetical protein ACOYLM_07095 [Methylococcaceae bacterium]
MNEQDLRDCFAMFAMCGIVSREVSELSQIPYYAMNAYKLADAMLEARKPREESGITAVKRIRKSK